MDNVIIKFAHVLETTDDEDDGVKFVGIFRGLLSLLYSQEIDLSYAGESMRLTDHPGFCNM